MILSEKGARIGRLFAEDIGNGQEYHGKYLKRAFGMLGNYHDAEEFVQSFYLRVMERAGSYRFEVSSLDDRMLGGWLNVIFTNMGTDMLRRKRKIKDAQSSIRLSARKSSEEDLAARMMEQEELKTVAPFINRLPLQYEDVAGMCYLCGMTGSKIAEIKGMGVRKVCHILKIVRKRFQRERQKNKNV